MVNCRPKACGYGYLHMSLYSGRSRMQIGSPTPPFLAPRRPLQVGLVIPCERSHWPTHDREEGKIEQIVDGDGPFVHISVSAAAESGRSVGESASSPIPREPAPSNVHEELATLHLRPPSRSERAPVVRSSDLAEPKLTGPHPLQGHGFVARNNCWRAYLKETRTSW